MYNTLIRNNSTLPIVCTKSSCQVFNHILYCNTVFRVFLCHKSTYTSAALMVLCNLRQLFKMLMKSILCILLLCYIMHSYVHEMKNFNQWVRLCYTFYCAYCNNKYDKTFLRTNYFLFDSSLINLACSCRQFCERLLKWGNFTAWTYCRGMCIGYYSISSWTQPCHKTVPGRKFTQQRISKCCGWWWPSFYCWSCGSC